MAPNTRAGTVPVASGAATAAVDRLTRRQAAVGGLYTGYACGAWDDIPALADELLGRPTGLDEFGGPAFVQQLRRLASPLFRQLYAVADGD